MLLDDPLGVGPWRLKKPHTSVHLPGSNPQRPARSKFVATKNLHEGSSVVRHVWKPGLDGNTSEFPISKFEHLVGEEALGVDVTPKCLSNHRGSGDDEECANVLLARLTARALRLTPRPRCATGPEVSCLLRPDDPEAIQGSGTDWSSVPNLRATSLMLYPRRDHQAQVLKGHLTTVTALTAMFSQISLHRV